LSPATSEGEFKIGGTALDSLSEREIATARQKAARSGLRALAAASRALDASIGSLAADRMEPVLGPE
jgi:hypothetical protein